MKIEIGESVIYSWLRHIKGCKIVQINWKTSPKWECFHKEEIYSLIEQIRQTFPNIFKKSTNQQILQQAEVDALGVCFNGGLPFFYAVEVAFHEDGLLYGNDTMGRVAKKLLRIALLLQLQFNTKQGEIIFATPKAHPKTIMQLKQKLQEISSFMKREGFSYHFSLIANDKFEEEIIQPLKDISAMVSDTTELFLRSYQLLCLLQKQCCPSVKPGVKADPPEKTSIISLLRDIGMQFFIKYYDYFQESMTTADILTLITEDYTEHSKRTRCSKAIRIFREGSQLEALELIANAQDIPMATKERAAVLLAQGQSKKR